MICVFLGDKKLLRDKKDWHETEMAQWEMIGENSAWFRLPREAWMLKYPGGGGGTLPYIGIGEFNAGRNPAMD